MNDDSWVAEGGALCGVCFAHSGAGPRWVPESGNVKDPMHRLNQQWEPMLSRPIGTTVERWSNK
ncbi:hypothetical protein [Duganella callida]|uniref:Uncharacterized protein n=1 Tax=Duganella callida TaxID=2561932 RepID=A0A4Y9S0D8_9BURK|nr:hypothetical protein [Duganella callida]TFW14840.1 hypothetical protein E4L98_27390 [Duganella callida]